MLFVYREEPRHNTVYWMGILYYKFLLWYNFHDIFNN